jgi:hypothetical protein
MLIKLVVGDWSGDGHDKHEDIYVDVNVSSKEELLGLIQGICQNSWI